MVVVDRKLMQQITVGNVGDILTEPIVITLVESGKTRSKIGVQAQRDVSISRGMKEVPVIELGVEIAAEVLGSSLPVVGCEVVSRVGDELRAAAGV